MTMAAATSATIKSLLSMIGMAAALTVGATLSVLDGVPVESSVVELSVGLDASLTPSAVTVVLEGAGTKGVTAVSIDGVAASGSLADVVEVDQVAEVEGPGML